MTYLEAKAARDQIETQLAQLAKPLKAAPRLENGLPVEAVRVTPEYQAAKAAYARTFAQLRAFNQVFVKQFASEIRAERNARFA